MLGEGWLFFVNVTDYVGSLAAQGRMYEWHWEMHPMWWWGLGFGMMAMMFLFWALVIFGFIVAVRWLLNKGVGEKADTALRILRERYARGEINKEEFEARKKDLGS
jgi:putative membrane protein